MNATSRCDGDIAVDILCLHFVRQNTLALAKVINIHPENVIQITFQKTDEKIGNEPQNE